MLPTQLLLQNFKNIRPTTSAWGSTTSLSKGSNLWAAPVAASGLLTPTSNLKSIDLEATRLRPKVVNQERELLYEDVLK
jgi:hypothetical protein